MNERINKRANERTNERTNERANEQANERASGIINCEMWIEGTRSEVGLQESGVEVNVEETITFF